MEITITYTGIINTLNTNQRNAFDTMRANEFHRLPKRETLKVVYMIFEGTISRGDIKLAHMAYSLFIAEVSRRRTKLENKLQIN